MEVVNIIGFETKNNLNVKSANSEPHYAVEQYSKTNQSTSIFSCAIRRNGGGVEFGCGGGFSEIDIENNTIQIINKIPPTKANGIV